MLDLIFVGATIFFSCSRALMCAGAKICREEFTVGWEAIVGVAVSALLLLYLTYRLAQT